jgi:hypothetical protein
MSDAPMTDEGFLSRWSRRKATVKEGGPAVAPHSRLEPVSERAPVVPPTPLATSPGPAPMPLQERPATEVQAVDARPLPTLADVALLGRDSDYAGFLAPGVDESVKRAAMKKLFTDPRYNVMDGLDTYIADYSQPDPIPLAMLRRMNQSQLLGLFSDDPQDTHPSEATPDGGTPPVLPQSATDNRAVPTDEDPDLRLQQDDAAGPGGTGEGPVA